MRAISTRGKTGADGVLHLSIPLGTPDLEYEVVVNLQPRTAEWPAGYFEEVAGSITDETFFGPDQCEPAASDATDSDWPPGFFEETAGAWQGELERAPQGEYEKREEL